MLWAVHSSRFIRASRCRRYGIINRIFKRHTLFERYSYSSVIGYLIVIEYASVTVYSSVTEYLRLRHVLLLSNYRGACMRHTLLLSREFLGAGRACSVFLAPHQNSTAAHRTLCTCDISTTVSLQSLRIS